MDTTVANPNEAFSTNNVRYIAVKLLNRFDRSDSYIDKMLGHTFQNTDLEPQDRALLTEIVNGVVRWRLKLDYVLIGFYRGDYQKCLNIIKNAMRVALYQILYLDGIPDYAAVNESVEIVKHIQGEKTAGLVNGVLRNIMRNINAIHYPNKNGQDFYYAVGVEHSHPKWMAKRFCSILGDEQGEAFMRKNNERPYLPLRINKLQTTMEEIKSSLEQSGIEYKTLDFIDSSLILESTKLDLSQNELLKSGKITVQDPAAAMACRLASPKPGDLVADICAAPGGKAFYMAELMNNTGRIIAYDLHPHKLKLISEGAERMKLSIIETQEEDAKRLVTEERFDLVFADVPCSGFGTIRKKPDIKWKREHRDIQIMAQYQRDLITNAATFIKPGGVLIYSTCTIDPMENEENIAWFLQQYPEFELDPAENYLPAEVCQDGMMKIFPHIHGTDGAFAARLKRKL